MKLTEKCLNNAIESPGLNARRVPPDLKSNILKAQVEAVHKVSFLLKDKERGLEAKDPEEQMKYMNKLHECQTRVTS